METPDVEATMRRLAIDIARFRYRFFSEKAFQDGIAEVMTACGWAFTREHHLAPGDIPDFFIDAHGIAVEVKIGGGLSEVTRQVHRYAVHPTVLGVLLLTSKFTLVRVPGEMNGKPVHVRVLSGGLV